MQCSPTARRSALLTAAGLAALFAAPRAAAQTYVIFELSNDGTGASQVYDINATGQMVGTTEAGEQGSHAAHWLNEEFTDLQYTVHLELQHPFRLFNVDYSLTYAISNGGQMVGAARTGIKCGEETITIQNAMILRPAVLSDLATPFPGDALTNLGTFGEPCSAFDSAATGISNADHVVGWADVDNGGTVHAFLVTPQNGVWYVDADEDLVNDILIDLGTLDGRSVVSSATAVNDSGVVVGFSYTRVANSNPAVDEDAVFHGFRLAPLDGDLDGVGDTWFFDDGNGGNALMTDLGTLGGYNSWARAINNGDQIVGESGTAEQTTHAFLWENGVMTDLGTLGGANSSASGINEAGDIAGWAETETGERHAVVWINGEIHDLNESLLATANPKITLAEARAINNNGQIAGWGVQKSGNATVNKAFYLRIATAAEIAEADLIANPPTDSGSGDAGDGNGGTGGAGGSGTFSGIPLLNNDNKPETPAADDSGDGAEPTPTVMPCGLGGAAMLPATLLGMCAMRLRPRRRSR